MKLNIKKIPLPYALLIPALIVITLVVVYPLFSTFLLSLQDYSLKTPWLNRGYILLENYTKAFANIRFWNALLHTASFTFISVLLELSIGLLIASLIHRHLFLKGLVRASVLLPWAIPTVVSAQMWRWMWHDKFGVMNYFLLKLNLISGYQAWLAYPFTAMSVIITADVWKTTPFMVLLLLAGLSYIPHELYEAAKVDGAGRWQRFRNITLPLLKPTVFVAVLFRSIDAFRIFDIIYVMTQGGPGNSTEVLSLYAYKTLFGSLDFGYGSALCVITFLCVILVSFVYARSFRISMSIQDEID